MKYGHFVGVHWTKGQVCFNSTPMTVEEFMDAKRISEPEDVIGPFEEADHGKMFRNRVAQFFVEHWKVGNRTLPVSSLMDLIKSNMV